MILFYFLFYKSLLNICLPFHGNPLIVLRGSSGRGQGVNFGTTALSLVTENGHLHHGLIELHQLAHYSPWEPARSLSLDSIIITLHLSVPLVLQPKLCILK